MRDRPEQPKPPSLGGVSDDPGTLTAVEPREAEVPPTEVAMYAIVLAGGIGSRFWPLSTPELPKQLLPLVNDRPLIADTVARLAPLIPPERVLIATSADIADRIHAAIPEIPERNMIVEPYPLGTAAALAMAVREIERRAGPRTVVVTLHADLAVGFPDEFRMQLKRAGALAARERTLVAVGVRPTRPETGFGYIMPGSAIDFSTGIADGGACHVARFREKPGAHLAEEMIRDGALWNSGIYVWDAGTVLDELRAFTHELAEGMPALESGDLATFIGRIQSVSLERGLLERTDNLLVLPADFGWDDVGTWACLRRSRDLDDHGNGAKGAAHFVDSTSNVVHAESGTVVLYGVHKMLVVSLDGLTFVTPLERAPDLKPLLDALPGSMRLKPRG